MSEAASQNAGKAPPSPWSALWLAVKVAIFFLAALEKSDIIVVAYQRF